MSTKGVKSQHENEELHHAGITVRVLLFMIADNCLQVVLVNRDHEPYKGLPGLPGGYIRGDETLEEAAERIVAELTGEKHLYIEQLYTFGDPDRDVNERWITVAYYALLPQNINRDVLMKQYASATCVPTRKLPQLAYDHQKMIEYAIARIKAKIGYSTIAHALLPEHFRLTELQNVYEVLLEEPIDKRNFRKKMLSLDLLEPTGNKVLVGSHRPAMQYRFKTKDLQFFN